MRLTTLVPPSACLLLVIALGLITPQAGAALPNYEDFDGVLLRNVRNGYVDYDGVALDPAFHRFVAALADTRPEDLPDRDERLAFLINAYNALAIQGILDGHSPATRLGRTRYFKRQKYRVLGQDLSLDDLERSHLLPLGEPRVRFAIVCASLSCPRLASRAYLPGSLSPRLDTAARAFVNDPTRNRFDPDRRTAIISRLFDWHGAEFEQAAGSLQAYLARYAADPATAEILQAAGFELRFMDYDWDLNGSRPGGAR